MIEESRILAHTQHVARRFIAWKGTLDALVEFVSHSMGADAPTAAQLDNFLRRPETQRILQAHYETALWKAADKTYRLVALAVPTDPEVARRRLVRFPASTTQCRWCQIDEKGFAHLELKPELDIRREQVPASYLHPNCQRSWLHMRALVERAETAKEVA